MSNALLNFTKNKAAKTVLIDYVENLKDQESNVISTNQIKFEALQKSLHFVLQVKEEFSSRIHTELLAYEFKNAVRIWVRFPASLRTMRC